MKNRDNNDTSDIRRNQLREAAYRLISRYGYGGVSIRDMAKEAGMSTGLVHYYFNNKEELLLSILSLMNLKLKERTVKALAKTTGPREKLERFIQLAFGQAYREREYYHVVVDFWSMASRNERMRKANARLLKSYIDVCSGILREGIDSGDFLELDIDYTATVILSLIQGVIIRHIVEKKAFNYEEYSSRVLGQIIAYIVKK